MLLKRFPVFFRVAVLKDAQIGRIARLGYLAVLNSLSHSASGLMGVSAVVITALMAELKYLREIMAHFLTLEVNGAEPFHSGGVDDVSSLWQPKHFGEGGRVHACVVCVGYFAGAKVGIGQQLVDKR